MGKLIDIFIEWALKKKRWPLLFSIGYLPLFQFVRNFFQLSYRETFRHWFFLSIGGVLLILSGIFYIAVVSPRTPRLKLGATIALGGAFFLMAGLWQLQSPALPEDTLVVAIASFTPVSPGAEDPAKNFTHRIEQKLQEKKSEGAPLIVRRLDCQINGPDEETRRNAAISLIHSRLGASHVVIWGTIRMDEEELYVQPRITIAKPLKNAPIERIGQLETASNEPSHIEFKERLSTEIADMVILVCGMAYYKGGNWDESISILKHVDSKEAFLMLGNAYLAKKDYQRCLLPLKKAIDGTPADAQIFNNLAMAYLYLGQRDDATWYLGKGLEIEPNNPDIISNLGLLQMGRCEYENAATNFRLALEFVDHPKTRSNLAFCLFELDRPQDAMNEWKKSLAGLNRWNKDTAIPWDGLDAKAGLAVGYYANGEIEKALEMYRDVLQRDGDYSDLQMLETHFFWPAKIKSAAADLIKRIDHGSE